MADIETNNTQIATDNNVNTQSNVDTNVNENANEALFKKLDDILAKRSDGIAKNILKEQGIEDTELKDLLNEYKQSKVNKVKNAESELAELRRKNDELSQIIKGNARNTAITTVASELGISSDNLKYVAKLADLSKIEKDGQFDNEAIKAALQKVLEDVPAFMSTNQTKDNNETENGFVKIGAKKTEQTKDELEVNRIRKLMGLPELTK